MEKKFLKERGNLIENICECNTYQEISDVLKLYLAVKTMEQLKNKIDVEVINGDLYVIEGGKKRKIVSATKELLKELSSLSNDKEKEE